MTLQQVKEYIQTQLTAPVNQVIKLINSLFAILDYTTTQVSEIIPDWDDALTFQTDGTDHGKYCKHPDTNGKKRIFETKVDDNINNEPPTNPLTTENAYWIEISTSSGSGIAEWAAGLFGPGLVIVYHTHSVDGPGLYRLLEPVRPYSSTDIEAEILTNKWEAISGTGKGGVAKTYANIAALLADQAEQKTDLFYLVTDASADATVDAGWAVYQKLATTAGVIGDYRKLAEAESLDLIISSVANGSETVAGVYEEGTDGEVQAGTATGSTGAKLVVTAAKLATWWTWVKTQTQTFAAKITFTSAPRFSSTTASQFLRVDANKDLESVAAATQAEMITGTDDTKPATAKSVEDKGSIKSVSISNGATGTTNIDCGLKQQVKVRFNTTVTGAITITKSNDTNLEILNIAVPVTGSAINVEFPSDTRMDRVFESTIWNQSTKVLTINAIGTGDLFEFSLMRIGSIFELRYGGPARA